MRRRRGARGPGRCSADLAGRGLHAGGGWRRARMRAAVLSGVGAAYTAIRSYLISRETTAIYTRCVVGWII